MKNTLIKKNKITYRNILLLVIFTLGIVGLVSIDRNRNIPITPIIEILFFLGSILLIKEVDKKALFFSIFSLSYIIYSSISAFVFMNTHILDFLQAYKAFIYIIFLSFAINRSIFDAKFIKRLFRFLLIIFAIKYSYSVFLGLDNRPIVFTENNFELILLLLVYYLHYIFQKNKLNWIEFSTLIYIFVLSGSRSAIVALFLVYGFMTIRKLNLKTIFSFFTLGILGLLVLFILLDRMGDRDLEGIDRVNFLLKFIYDTQDWEWWRWLIGSPALTPLSDYTCHALSFYKSLFSYKQDGSCYSVIYHSYILRVIYDHGVLGLIFLTTFINYGLKKAEFIMRERIAVIGVLLVTSLSVSSLNNTYVIIAILFYFARGKNAIS